jgi:hypothetical protein
MKHFTAAILAAALTIPATVAAQIKTIPGEAITLTATIEAIERTTRTVTLKDPDGAMTVLQVPADVTRFNELKVGDTIVARYYENIVLRKKAPGEKDAPGTTQASITRGKGARPGATASQQRTITATITAIDEKVPSITLAGPNNWTFSSRVEDRAALKQVKVGDRLDITWTEAVMVSAESPKK